MICLGKSCVHMQVLHLISLTSSTHPKIPSLFLNLTLLPFLPLITLLKLHLKHLIPQQVRIPIPLIKKILHNRILIPSLLITTTTSTITRIQLISSHLNTNVRITPTYIWLVICHWSRFYLVVITVYLILNMEDLSLIEAEHHASLVVDVGLWAEWWFWVPTDYLTILHSD